MTATAEALEELVQHRRMLFALAYRLLGSVHDAHDVLQETYLRWARVDRTTVVEPRRYLTRVVTRLALDQLRDRQARRETYVGPWLPEPLTTGSTVWDDVEQQESVSFALLHLMERLSPPQRAVYVLRTAFDLPYADIAEVIDRTVEDCRQLFRRATAALDSDRRRYAASRQQHAELLTAFVAAARDADLDRLERVLHADVTAWNDGGGRVRAARNPIRGSEKVARFFAGVYGRGPVEVTVRPIDLNGSPSLLVTRDGETQAVTCAVSQGRIIALFLVSNPDKLAALAG